MNDRSFPNDGSIIERHEDVERAAQAWREQWPNHCPMCRGWGGHVTGQPQPFAMGTTQEPLFVLCEATLTIETCHRCGQPGLSENGGGPCPHCGWDFNDGEPQ